MRDGTHVRLSLRGSGRADAGSLASFRSIPGVTRVRSSADPDTRYVWLTGSNPAGLRDHAVQLQSKSADVRALLDVPESELAITPDRERLAALGIPVADFAVQLQLARVGVELGQLLDDAGVLPVWLRLGDGEVSIYELRELVLQAPDQRQVALGSLAELRMIETEPARCRHADRPAVLLAVRAATWAQLARELPASLSWSWRD
jgi:multidrug efflux pump subunit AcrB